MPQACTGAKAAVRPHVSETPSTPDAGGHGASPLSPPHQRGPTPPPARAPQARTSRRRGSFRGRQRTTRKGVAQTICAHIDSPEARATAGTAPACKLAPPGGAAAAAAATAAPPAAALGAMGATPGTNGRSRAGATGGVGGGQADPGGAAEAVGAGPRTTAAGAGGPGTSCPGAICRAAATKIWSATSSWSTRPTKILHSRTAAWRAASPKGDVTDCTHANASRPQRPRVSATNGTKPSPAYR